MIQTATKCAVAVFHGHAAEIKFKRGKTEVMLTFRGEGTQQLARDLCFDSGMMIKTTIGSRVYCINVAQTYKHLGTMTDTTFSRAPECKHRISSTIEPFRALKKRIFKIDKLPVPRKWIFSESLCVTRLAYNLYTDSRMPKNAYASIARRYMTIVRSTSRCHSIAAEQKFFSDNEALAASLALPWNQVMALARLRYLARAMQSAPDVLFALLEDGSRHTDSWNELIRRDCSWLHSVVGHLYGIPEPEHDWESLMQWINDNMQSWQSAVRLAKKMLVRRIRNDSSRDVFVQAIHAALDEVGLPDVRNSSRAPPEKTVPTDFCLPL